ncbi:MAG: branched-chain amino acid ABC transporter permease [Deltaproteobacteria bacterium]|nr:branched-chain amino acid ABC transporter permease [Deltaproteobacteria bacterium]MBW2049662.1 branched-chain amino acid ABC transporter permease [Deltaproteobacteria bacterium]MBW2110111.1 branched-chain amino acid ABC transporter permease [Deltaproteobacteria bacterium]MBW2354562.1 branched-chain amino acid ABC transporter permease [Deltaproteobacteria bacterium]HDZ91194.1 branched-chain amino acid ABC transporter permease [Deltaproteobacteria bacterium]
MPAGLFHESYRNDERIFQTWFVRAWLMAFLIACVLFPVVGSKYMVSIMTEVGIAIIACHGLNILTGFTGQISLGHAAFLGVGAYTCSILIEQGVPFIIVLPLAGAMTALVGMIFGIPSLRLRGLYLAIATIAAQFIIEFTIRRWDSLTGGVEGMFVEPGTIGPFHFDNRVHLYYLTLILAVAATVVIKNIVRARSGRAFVAVRDRYLAAEVIGVHVFKYRLMSFAVSSFFAGIAGALLAQYLEVITHESFTIHQSIDYLAMCIIGGLGHVLGGIYGVGFWFILERILELVTTNLNTAFPDHITWFVSIKEIVFGCVIVLFLIFEPDGLAARWRTIRAYWKLWPFSY